MKFLQKVILINQPHRMTNVFDVVTKIPRILQQKSTKHHAKKYFLYLMSN